jgi:hypothetical protein
MLISLFGSLFLNSVAWACCTTRRQNNEEGSQYMDKVMNALHLETILISIIVFFLHIIVAEVRNITFLQKL